MPLKFQRRMRVRRGDGTDTGTVQATRERLPSDGYNEYGVVWDHDPDWIEEDIPENELEHAEKGVPHDAQWRTTHSRDMREIREQQNNRRYQYPPIKTNDDPIARLNYSDRKNVVR